MYSVEGEVILFFLREEFACSYVRMIPMMRVNFFFRTLIILDSDKKDFVFF